MSRFYDVLKNASQSAPTPHEGRGEGESESFHDTSFHNTDVADMLANFQETVGNRAVEPQAGPANHSSAISGSSLFENAHTLVEEILPPVVPPSPIVSTPRNGSFGTTVQMRVAARTRLLPNLVGSMSMEHYRLLRTQIFQKQAEKMFRTLLVTSPHPQEGKTLTVLNLGLIFAMLPSFKVLVVDGDIRKGSLEQWLGVEGRPGFSDLIQGSARLEDVVLKSDDIPISFMVRGTSKLSAPELLHSPQMRSQLQEMTKHFDLVLVDSPPTNLVTDAQLLASACEAVLIVARAFSTPQESLKEARKKLLGSHVIGTVLNGRSENVRGYGYHSYYEG